MHREAPMSTVLIVDGSDVCRGPIMEFALQKQFAGDSGMADVTVVSRGLEAEGQALICDLAAGRLGTSLRAATFSVSHRSRRLVAEDTEQADLILTAERLHRSAVVRLSPIARARTFTLKEALVLTSVLTDEVRSGRSPRPLTLPDTVALLDEVRGSIPLIEPPMHTSVFHRDRALPASDPLALTDGHDDAALHRHATDEAYQVALTLGSRIVDLTEDRLARIGTTANDWWWRQHA
jgi:protein-tyrosine phosphatase